jgi:hypothetical protein
MAIKTLLDLNTLSVEELIGQLKAIKERYDLSDGGSGSMASLNLTEDELVAHVMSQLQLSGEGSLGGGRSSNQHRGHGGGRGRDGDSSNGSKPPTSGNG